MISLRMAENQIAEDLNAEIHAVLREIVKNHKRIIFNGNNYSEEWIEEAKRRGLPNIRSTVEAIKALIDEKTSAYSKNTRF